MNHQQAYEDLYNQQEDPVAHQPPIPVYETTTTEKSRNPYASVNYKINPMNYGSFIQNPYSYGYQNYAHSPGHGNNRHCNCPVNTRQTGCFDTGRLWTLLLALGRSGFELARVLGTSSAPILIPLVVIKTFLIPIKFLGVILFLKLLVKLFVVLPFFVKVVIPALTQFLLPHAFFKHLFGAHSTLTSIIGKRNEEQAEDKMEKISEDEDQESFSVELENCPSKAGCEIGAFLAKSTRTHFPKGFVYYLKDLAKEANSDYESKKFASKTDHVYDAFMIALGDRWDQDKCGVYRCMLIL